MKLQKEKDDLVFEAKLTYLEDQGSDYQRPIIPGTKYAIWIDSSSKVIPIRFLKIDSEQVLRGESKWVTCNVIGSWYFKDAFENLATFGFGLPNKPLGKLEVKKLIGYL